MLNIEWIKERIEYSSANPCNVSVNIPDNKGKLRMQYANNQPAIEFKYAESGIDSSDQYLLNDVFVLLQYMQTYKVKDRKEYNCFKTSKIDYSDMSYGQEKRKLTRVLSDILSHCDCIGDIYHTWYGQITCHENIKTIYLKPRLNNIGRIPRAYADDPTAMPIPTFVAWIGEQMARMNKGKETTYYIDFRPESCLLAGNGEGFSSCFGLPYFPYQGGSCFNNSPSAYAYSPHTAIMYSLAEDGYSLTNRTWVYFIENGLYFGRFYGRDVSRKVCNEAARLLGFNPSDRNTDVGGVYNIARGQTYLSDSIEVGYGNCFGEIDHSNKIDFAYRCISCGEEIGRDASDCLCEDCLQSKQYCEKCGDEVDEDDAIYVEGYGLCCNDCASICHHCGGAHLNRYMTDIGGTYRTVMVCSDCLNEYYAYCDVCEEWYNIDDISYIESEDRAVCTDCLHRDYVYCEQCNEYHDKDECTKCHDCGEWVCNDCSTVCARCGVTICNECSESHNDYEYCTTCYSEIVEAEDAVDVE